MRVVFGALLIAASISSAALAAETLTQHHDWSRKFAAPLDTDATGSLGILPDVEIQPAAACPGADRRFDRLPFEPWRVIRCDRRAEASLPLLPAPGFAG